MDFGLAKLIDNSTGIGMMHRQSQTGIDFAVGTPGYISPEQVRGDTVDYRSDIYSVGVILYELLTGKLPFSREDTMDVLFAHATEPPPSFTEVGASDWVPAEVEQVVLACLAKTPTDRPGSARELAERFTKAVQDSVQHEMENSPDEPVPVSAGAEETVESSKTTVLPQPKPMPYDPNVVVHQMEAWMPDTIASYKLRGFVQDIGGEVLESVPGMIRVRIGKGQGAFSWLGLGRKGPIVDVELRLERNNPKQQNLLRIIVLMTTPDRKVTTTPAWRERCNEIFCELRSYLAGAAVQS
jgi:serine/threonine-protein kinase